MAKRTARDFALIGRIFSEVGSGRITSAFIQDGRNNTDGYCEGGRIYVNEYHQTADTVIHEVLHRVFPTWSETTVRRKTTYLRLRMLDEEIVTLVEEYRRRARKRRTPISIEDR